MKDYLLLKMLRQRKNILEKYNRSNIVLLKIETCSSQKKWLALSVRFVQKGVNMNYYNEIKNKIIENEVYTIVKDYSKERHKVITYFEIGKLLNEVGGKYGDNIIDEYSKKLVVEVGKKYNRRTLFRMKQFYKIFNDEKVSQLATQLSWSHWYEML